jgi:hypothetical protein
LVHGIYGNKNSRVAYSNRGDTSDSSFGMPMVMHIRIIKHDLTPTTQSRARIRLTFQKAVNDLVT